jgi:hypothetical protein
MSAIREGLVEMVIERGNMDTPGGRIGEVVRRIEHAQGSQVQVRLPHGTVEYWLASRCRNLDADQIKRIRLLTTTMGGPLDRSAEETRAIKRKTVESYLFQLANEFPNRN